MFQEEIKSIFDPIGVSTKKGGEWRPCSTQVVAINYILSLTGGGQNVRVSIVEQDTADEGSLSAIPGNGILYLLSGIFISLRGIPMAVVLRT